MELSGVHRIKLDNIKVDKTKRQRQRDRSEDGILDVESDGLLDSIKKNGVISPILINKNGELIFGERRFEASKRAGLKDIPVIFAENLSPIQLECFELIENIRRKNLHWTDEARAVDRFHKLALKENPQWTAKESAQELGYNYEDFSRVQRVIDDLSDERVSKCVSLREAYNLLSRRDDRARQDIMNEIEDIGRELDHETLVDKSLIGNIPIDNSSLVGLELQSTSATGPSVAKGNGVPSSLPTNKPIFSIVKKRLCDVPATESILNIEFGEWVKTYNGPRFNFIHCDFPYGKGVFGGPQSGRARHDSIYDDREDVYWNLIKVFCENLDKFMAPSSHLMFWLENDIETQNKTIQRFRDLAPSLIFNTTPLIWHKTDNVGIINDPKRSPRNIYETALIASRDDRLIVKSVSNAHGSPTDKSLHPSTKPEALLKIFFSMFIDGNSRVFDPTCGSGSALRAAEALGAQYTLGLERDEGFYKGAVGALQASRNKRRLEQ